MANHGYMTITGNVQGLISAGCSTQDSIGTKFQAAHADQIIMLSYSHSMANIGSHGKPNHSPINFSKNIDQSSPLLAQALANREQLTCSISFYRTSVHGLQEKFYSVELKGGIIADLMVEMPHTLLQDDSEPQEHLSIRYQEISWTHHLAGTSGSSTWQDEA